MKTQVRTRKGNKTKVQTLKKLSESQSMKPRNAALETDERTHSECSGMLKSLETLKGGVDSKLSTKTSLNHDRTNVFRTSFFSEREATREIPRDYSNIFNECIEEDEDEYRQQS